MLKIGERLVERIFDPMKIQPRLNEIAAEEQAAGNNVERGPMGSVIIKLKDGEVHLVPSGRGIEEVLFKY